MSVLLFALARQVYGIFTGSEQVLALCKWVMLVEIPLEIGRAVNIVMCRALQACGDIRFPITICVISAWTVSVGGGFLLSQVLGLGLVGLWIGQAADECIRALLFRRLRSGVCAPIAWCTPGCTHKKETAPLDGQAPAERFFQHFAGGK